MRKVRHFLQAPVLVCEGFRTGVRVGFIYAVVQSHALVQKAARGRDAGASVRGLVSAIAVSGLVSSEGRERARRIRLHPPPHRPFL